MFGKGGRVKLEKINAKGKQPNISDKRSSKFETTGITNLELRFLE